MLNLKSSSDQTLMILSLSKAFGFIVVPFVSTTYVVCWVLLSGTSFPLTYSTPCSDCNCIARNTDTSFYIIIPSVNRTVDNCIFLPYFFSCHAAYSNLSGFTCRCHTIHLLQISCPSSHNFIITCCLFFHNNSISCRKVENYRIVILYLSSANKTLIWPVQQDLTTICLLSVALYAE